MKKSFAIASLVFFSAILSGCIDSDDNGGGGSSIKIAEVDTELRIGNGGKFSTEEFVDGNSQGINNNVTYKSSDPKVLKVDEKNGTYIALKGGSAEITATYYYATDSVKMAVDSSELIGIELSTDHEFIHIGQSMQATAMGLYTDGEEIDISAGVTWYADPEDTVNIDENGLISGRGEYDAVKVSAEIDELEIYSESIEINVLGHKPIEIIVTDNNEGTYVGFEKDFTAMAVWSNGTTDYISHLVTWSSLDEKLTHVEGRAFLPNEAGSGEIKAVYGATEGTEIIHIKERVYIPGSIKVELIDGVNSIEVEEKTQIKATARFSDADYWDRDISTQVEWGFISVEPGLEGDVLFLIGRSDVYVEGINAGNVEVSATYNGEQNELKVGLEITE